MLDDSQIRRNIPRAKSRSNVLNGACRLGQLLLLSLYGCDAEPSSPDTDLPSQTTSTTSNSSNPTNQPTTVQSSTTSATPTGTPPVNPTSATCSPVPTPTSSEPGGTTGATGSTAGSSSDQVTSEAEHSQGPSGSSNDSTDAATPPNSDRASEVCRRWNEDRADMSEGTWSGSIDECDAGDIGEPGRANALKLVNLYRFLAEMPEVEMDPERNQRAQECALMQSANGLSHEPPTSWKCYTTVGADASGVSSISGGPGVMSIDLYMTDGEFNADTMGHRRWVFANSLGPVGFGSATSSCFYQADGTGDARKPFVAWPPPGPVPRQALETTDVDNAGWTIQSDSVDLDDATVAVEEGGESLPVTQATLPGGYGSRYALRIVPSDWTLQAGHSYHVTVSGTEIDYSIDVVDCTD
jgi:hypothetical protein